MWLDERPTPLAEKLQTFDDLAAQAADFLISRLIEDRARIIAVARERHIVGHKNHGDGLLYEYDSEQLDEEILEELADAVVYRTRQLHLANASVRSQEAV